MLSMTFFKKGYILPLGMCVKFLLYSIVTKFAFYGVIWTTAFEII